MSQRHTRPVEAAATSFRIIEALRNLGGAGASELANHLDMPKSTVYDHLQTLTDIKYLVKDEGTYYVGAQFLSLGGYARSQMKLYRVAASELQKLAEQTGEHVNLMIEEHGRGIFLQKIKGEDAVELDTYVGMRVYLQTTSLGKAILAHLPERRVDEILEMHGLPRITENTITDPAELKRELAEIRERGYAVDNEERVEGMRCVGAPILDSTENAIGAVSVSGPVSRLDEEKFTTTMPKKVLSTANVIEVNMTYS